MLPADVAAIDAYADGTDQSIVDSGTSGLVLPKRAFEAAVATLSAAAPDVPRAFWKGEACVDASKLDLSSLPELTVSLATEGDDVVLTMPACRYVNRVPKTSYCAAEAPPRQRLDGRHAVLGRFQGGELALAAILGGRLHAAGHGARCCSFAGTVFWAGGQPCGAALRARPKTNRRRVSLSPVA